MSAANEGYARAGDGARIFYQVHEPHGTAGTPVLLIMGLGMNGRMWAPAIERLLARGHRVITLDNRGTGHSDVPRRPWSIARMGDDAVRVLDAVGIARAHVHGVSMGGMIAQELALRHPERVASLALGATTSGLPRPALPRFAAIVGLVGAGVRSFRPADDHEAAFRRILALITTPEFAAEATLDGPVAETLRRAMETPTTGRGYFLQLAAATQHRAWRRLRGLRVPTLIQHGTRDTIMPVRSARVLAARIPGARLDLIEGVGHAYAMERPEESSAALLDFFAAHDDRIEDPGAAPRMTERAAAA